MKKNILGACLLSSSFFLAACAPDEQPSGGKASQSTSTVQQESPTNYHYERNQHTFDVDTVSGATTGNYEGTAYTGKEKTDKMFWSGRPEVGTIVGDYYTDTLNFDGGYIASVDVVTKDGTLLLVEFDERAPDNYYSPDWASQTKRTSGYANFQAENDRTNVTLVTLVNAMTVLESQMVKENRLTGDFFSVKGSSNSVTRGFIPLAKKLSEQVSKESSETYHAITKDLGDGLFGRLIVITSKREQKIVAAHYNEFFADSSMDIKNEDEKPFYRQSKYDSSTYKQVSGIDFKQLSDAISQQIIEHQQVTVTSNDELIQAHMTEFSKEMTQLLQQEKQ